MYALRFLCMRFEWLLYVLCRLDACVQQQNVLNSSYNLRCTIFTCTKGFSEKRVIEAERERERKRERARKYPIKYCGKHIYICTYTCERDHTNMRKIHGKCIVNWKYGWWRAQQTSKRLTQRNVYVCDGGYWILM